MAPVTRQIPGAAPAANEALIWGAGLALAAAQSALLMRGWRITGDDVLFFDAALRGWHASADLTWNLATNQGRVGALIIIPINILSAWLADLSAFRLAAIALYFSAFYLFSVWVERLIVQRIAATLFLLLAGFNVTGYLHLPPIAYPLQNTIPFLVILGARLFLMSPARGSRLARAVALAAFGFGMIASEYGFLLGTAMLGCEWLHAALRSGDRAEALRLLGSRAIWPGLLVAALVLAAYLGWRAAFPSQYDGNQVGPLNRLPHGLLTALAHMFSPYALPYFGTMRVASLPGTGWTLVSAAYGALAAIGFFASRQMLSGLRHAGCLAGLSFATGLYLALPAALTLKQQAACFDMHACAFLDSQMAYLATSVIGAALCGRLIALPRSETVRRHVAAVLACLAGIGAAYTFLYDHRVTTDMAHIADVWKAARITACGSELPAGGLSERFDPSGRLRLHPGFDSEAFWQAYVAARRPDCR